ncbi:MULTISPECIES: ribbon-helix-helix protein, CopG family [Sphingomonas]|jgi:antitoxin VapB|uniref:Ribbon-helix-helix protein, CopG family n=1 Tax=Sphingomonas zeae TaxID=1646122 RepID=A0A7Y6B9D9_9SPHN|nr:MULTISPECIES: type II toxin-antitoxin system VapB family antitoxin [Sphingomonas]MBB4046795.1 antitoxin VapB [Sphingomonas zeae]MDK8184569.1 ribbon-helix-helix protein, CopG family [Sphingomonas zeae]MDK8214342.1 ribbon-helix-helix protein, CopG family [Sphingomonas sp. UMB7805-LC452B]NUU48901.1 ribbon-helix-helix protein, CopG family [Sphingomonas zeae]
MAERDPYPPLTLGSETSEQVARAAKRLGVSEEEAIRRALAELLGKPEPVPPRPNLREWLAEYRRQHPLPPPTGLLADKAFYDDLSGGL